MSRVRGRLVQRARAGDSLKNIEKPIASQARVPRGRAGPSSGALFGSGACALSIQDAQRMFSLTLAAPARGYSEQDLLSDDGTAVKGKLANYPGEE